MPKCDVCGVESPIESAFMKERKFLRGSKAYCPSCWSKRESASDRRLLLGYAVGTILGVACVLIDPFSVLGWTPLNLVLLMVFVVFVTLPHEFAHALFGILLGMRVFKISIGSGKTIYKQKLAGIELEIKAIPWPAMTVVVPTTAKFYRLKRFLVVLAGPLVSFLVFAIALAAMIMRPISDWLPSAGLWFLPLLALSNLLVLVNNLWPRESCVAGQEVPSDGLALLKTPFLSESEIREGLALYYVVEAFECYQQKQFEAAEQWHRKGLAKYPGDKANLSGLATNLFYLKDFEKARDVFEQILGIDGLDPHMRTSMLNNIAYTDVLIARAELLEEADRYSLEAFQNEPWLSFVKGTRGAVLVELGKMDEGLPLLTEAMETNDDPHSKAFNACHIAVGEKRRGNLADAKRYFESARTLDPECILLDKVADELKGAETESNKQNLSAPR